MAQPVATTPRSVKRRSRDDVGPLETLETLENLSALGPTPCNMMTNMSAKNSIVVINARVVAC